MNKNSSPREVLEEEGWSKATQNRTRRGRHCGKAVAGTKPRPRALGTRTQQPCLEESS